MHWRVSTEALKEPTFLGCQFVSSPLNPACVVSDHLVTLRLAQVRKCAVFLLETDAMKHMDTNLTDVDMMDAHSQTQVGRATVDPVYHRLRPGFVIDLGSSRPDYEHGNCRLQGGQMLLEETMEKHEPSLIIESAKMAGPEEAVECYRKQIKGGRYFLHEHPADAMLTRAGFGDVQGPVCRFEIPLSGNGTEYVRKETRFLTNSTRIWQESDRMSLAATQ